MRVTTRTRSSQDSGPLYGNRDVTTRKQAAGLALPAEPAQRKVTAACVGTALAMSLGHAAARLTGDHKLRLGGR
jgi:hypothetical protein